MTKSKDTMQAAMQAHTEAVLAAPRKPRPLDKTALSYWFPLIQAAGLPVPKTTISLMPVPAREAIWTLFDGKEPMKLAAEGMAAFIEHLKLMAEQVGGYPCFMRTDPVLWRRRHKPSGGWQAMSGRE